MREFLSVAALVAAISVTTTAQAQYLIVGNDEKVVFKDGRPVLSPSGKDTVSIIDIGDPVNPRIVANLPLENSVIGPPTNLAITPDNKLALVANSVDVAKDGDNLKTVPDNKLYVIDSLSPNTLKAAKAAIRHSPRRRCSCRLSWRCSLVELSTRA